MPLDLSIDRWMLAASTEEEPPPVTDAHLVVGGESRGHLTARDASQDLVSRAGTEERRARAA